MARLTQDQWERVRSDWCTGLYTYRQLGDMHNVSDAAIIKRKNEEEWEALPAELVDQYVEAKKATKLAIAEVSKVSKVSAANLEDSLDRAASDRAKIESVGMLLVDKIAQMADKVEKPSDIQALASAHKSLYEPRFKTSPETAIQINNSNTSENPAASVLNALNRKYNDT